MNYINYFMYLMCNFKYFCKNYRFCIYTVVMENNKKKKKKMCPWSIFLMNFNIIFKTLKFMKSCTKSIITKKVLHLQYFVKVCYSATLSIATTR